MLVRVGLLAFVLTATAFVPGGHAQDPIARFIQIEVGDWWEFRISGKDDGTIRNEIDARGTHTNWFGAKHDVYRVHATGTITAEQDLTGFGLPGAPVEFDIDVRKWVRTSDHAVVEIEGNSTAQGQEAIHALESFNPPMVEAVFEFGVGWRWSAEVAYHAESSGSAEEEISPHTKVSYYAEVEAYETVTVPAGTFHAWRINLTSYKHSNAWTLQWYSETTCDIVKEERYDDDGNLINRLELTDYDCNGTPLPRPTYDPAHVTLLARGDPLPSDWNRPPTPDPSPQGKTSSAGGLAALLGAFVIALAAVGLIGWRRRP